MRWRYADKHGDRWPLATSSFAKLASRIAAPAGEPRYGRMLYEMTTIRTDVLSNQVDDGRHFGLPKEGLIASQVMLGVLQTAEGAAATRGLRRQHGRRLHAQAHPGKDRRVLLGQSRHCGGRGVAQPLNFGMSGGRFMCGTVGHPSDI